MSPGKIVPNGRPKKRLILVIPQCRSLADFTELENLSLLSVLNITRPEIDYHFVIFFVSGVAKDPLNLQNVEPDKCHEWKWLTREEFLTTGPKFFPLQEYLDRGCIIPFGQ